MICVLRLIARHLARLHSVNVAASAAQSGDDVNIDTKPSLFVSLYNFMNHGAFNSTEPRHQARFD